MKKTLSRGVRKHIRRKKAEIRRRLGRDTEEAKAAIKALVNSYKT